MELHLPIDLAKVSFPVVAASPGYFFECFSSTTLASIQTLSFQLIRIIGLHTAQCGFNLEQSYIFSKCSLPRSLPLTSCQLFEEPLQGFSSR